MIFILFYLTKEELGKPKYSTIYLNYQLIYLHLTVVQVNNFNTRCMHSFLHKMKNFLQFIVY
jgi:hypothetical protein